MSVQDMRNALKRIKKYASSTTWAARVDRMPDDQIIAIYYRMARAGVLQ